MQRRRFGRETQCDYIRDDARFALFWNARPPDTATAEELRRLQIT
jgi:hypothetical protein